MGVGGYVQRHLKQRNISVTKECVMGYGRICELGQLCRQWRQHKLSLRQYAVPPVTTELASLQLTVFSEW